MNAINLSTMSGLEQTMLALFLMGLGYLLRHLDLLGLHSAAAQAVANDVANAINPQPVPQPALQPAAGTAVQLGKHQVSLAPDGSVQIATPQAAPPPKVTTVPAPS